MFYESRDWDIATYADNSTSYWLTKEGDKILKTENEASELFY